MFLAVTMQLKYQISPDEMKKIALSYVSDQTVNDIPNICLYDFFPLLCALYSKMNHQDPRFFIHPVEIIEKEISEMKTKSETDFLCLSLLVLKNNELSKAELKSGKLGDLLKNVCREGEIESVVSTVSIQQSFERFEGIYISESDQSYKAIHDKMFDIISAAVSPSIVECLIKNVDIAFLANRTQLASFSKSSLPFIIYIPQKFKSIYLQRQYKAVVEGKYWEVFGSQQTENEGYRKLLLSILTDQNNIQPISYASCEDGTTPLFVSSSSGYVDFVRYFMVKCPNDKNAKDKTGRSSFYAACKNGHLSTVKYLLECCVDTTIKDEDGLSALHAAAYAGHTEIVKFWIELKMSINDTTENGKTILHLACCGRRYDTVKFLLGLNQPTSKRIVDTSIKDTAGCTALHHACCAGNTKVVKLLIDVGMDINVKCDFGCTPFNMACVKGHLNIVRCLLRKHDKAILCIDDITETERVLKYPALHLACLSENTELVQLLIDFGMDINALSKDGLTPLHTACREGTLDTVKFLLNLQDQTLKSRVDLMAKEETGGITPLHTSCGHGHTEMVRILIDAGMDVNVTTSEGLTPLIIACFSGKNDTVKFLLDIRSQTLIKRVDLLVKTVYGMTALHEACYEGHTEVVKLLIDAGMNMNDTTSKGCTPLMLACNKERSDTVKFLLNIYSKTLSSREDLLVKNSMGMTALHEACFSGHTEVAKLLIDAGMNVNDTTSEGLTPLSLACGQGRYDTVKFSLHLNSKTLSNHVDLLVHGSDGFTALHTACLKGHTEVVKLLIDAGMNVNDTTSDGLTPLIEACRQGRFNTVEFLLDLSSKTLSNHVDLLVHGSDGFTALHIACLEGHTEVVKLLVDAGMNLNDTTSKGFTPLIVACGQGRYDTVQHILNFHSQTLNRPVDLKIKDSRGCTALHAACYNGYREIVNLLIDVGMNVNDTTTENFTPLILACGQGCYDTVKFLLDLKGQNLNSRVDLMVKDSYGFTALHIACNEGHTEVVKILIDAGMNVNDTAHKGMTSFYLACHNGRYDTVKFLLDLNNQTSNSRVDLMVKDSVGFTALHKACTEGHTEVVMILIDAGMNVNSTTHDGLTPLHVACGKGNHETAKFLIDLNHQTSNSRVDLMVKDSVGCTALHTACCVGHTEVVKLLIDDVLNVNDTTDKGYTPFYLACCMGHCEIVIFLLDLNHQTLNSRVDLMVKNSEGCTAFHKACYYGRTEVIKLLIEAGMNVNNTTTQGFTPLYLACYNGHHKTVTILLDSDRKNLNSRVDIVVEVSSGHTALHAACAKGHTEVVKLLINAGMNVNTKTNDGFSPLILACREAHYDTVKLLLDLNAQSISSRVNLMIKDSEGFTPLHRACYEGRTDVAMKLIDAGMSVNDTTDIEYTPLFLANHQDHQGTVKFLLGLNDKTLKSRVYLMNKDAEVFTV